MGMEPAYPEVPATHLCDNHGIRPVQVGCLPNGASDRPPAPDTRQPARTRMAKVVQLMEGGLVSDVNYEWTQTVEDLTLTLQLPPGTTARDVRCTTARGVLTIGLSGTPAPLVDGILHAGVSDSVWMVERGSFSLHIDKAKHAFWPCALVGHAQVDVKALEAARKRDLEPAYKPPPGARPSHPRPLRGGTA